MVDVGQSQKSGGARSARGSTEYEFNLRLATQIVQALLDRGFAKTTLLITERSSRSGLFKRVERANSLAADLFLSIHHDSVPNQFLEKWDFEGAKHIFSDRFKGHSIFISNDNGDRAGSLLFGQLLGARDEEPRPAIHAALCRTVHGQSATRAGGRNAGVYRYDQLIVLRQTRMPAVLLEAGSIIHRYEEMEMRTPERRALITEAAVDAVLIFCAQRSRLNRRVQRRRRTVAPQGTACQKSSGKTSSAKTSTAKAPATKTHRNADVPRVAAERDEVVEGAAMAPVS